MANDSTKTPPDMKLRISSELRRKIEDSARLNGRTMNGEIVVRLEESFALEPDVKERLDKHQKLIDELMMESHDYAKRIIALQTQVEELVDAVHRLKSTK